MKLPTVFFLVIAAGAAGAALPQGQTPPPPAPSTAPNTDSHYQLGPDSLPRDGVAKGEVRGPYTLPSEAQNRSIASAASGSSPASPRCHSVRSSHGSVPPSAA